MERPGGSQRRSARVIRNILDKVRDWARVKRGLHAVMNAPNVVVARAAARRFADRWEGIYPRAVACLRNDLDDLLHFLGFDTEWRVAVRTTNAIE